MKVRHLNMETCRNLGASEHWLARLRDGGKPIHNGRFVELDAESRGGKSLYAQYRNLRKNPRERKPETEKKAPKEKVPPLPPSLVPRAKRPRWARLVGMLRKSEDNGIGDTVARIAAKFGGERFKAWAEKLGIPCGCSDRQEDWNARYPY